MTWSLLVPIRTSFQFAIDLVNEFANNQFGDQLGWTFRNFKLQEATWKQQIEDKIGAIIYSHLFNARQNIGKAMQKDFYLAIAATKTSNVEKRIMKTTLDNLTVESL